MRTYIPEARRKHESTWSDKPAAQKADVYRNRRRTCGKRRREPQRQRSERVERSFAHVCRAGGAWRTSLTGIESVRKPYAISAAAHYLGCIMRTRFTMGSPRGLQAFRMDLREVLLSRLDWHLSLAGASETPARSPAFVEIEFALRRALSGGDLGSRPKTSIFNGLLAPPMVQSPRRCQ